MTDANGPAPSLTAKLPNIHRLRVLPGGGVKWLHPHAPEAALPAGLMAAIGSFDGVHLGHQTVIRAATDAARAKGHASAVITFDPHPQTYFRPDSPPFRLMNLTQQVRAFGELGVDHVVVLGFDAAVAALSAADFAAQILKAELDLSLISAGFDFTFGARGQGRANDLVALGAEFGFETAILPAQTDAEGRKLSSSGVREALETGDVARATAILGRPQAYMGEVIRGAQMGRTIGFATLNMELGDYQRPQYGVYVTRTRLADGRAFGGVSNIGKRPTVDGLTERLETHLFDFAEDIYGQIVEVELLDFLRPEMRFSGLDALKARIAKDAETARIRLG